MKPPHPVPSAPCSCLALPLQKINEKPQVIADYESGKAIPNNQVLGKIERAIGECESHHTPPLCGQVVAQMPSLTSTHSATNYGAEAPQGLLQHQPAAAFTTRLLQMPVPNRVSLLFCRP